MAGVELVGILNITPDSFSDSDQYVHTQKDGSETVEVDKAISAAQRIFAEGASYLDIGGESTRPGATALTPEQEWQRINLVVTKLIPIYPGQISVDSYHPETHARLCSLNLGDFIINDVTGFNNAVMVSTAGRSGMRCIISHLPAAFGNDIQAAHGSKSPMDSIDKLAQELLNRQQQLIGNGVSKCKIILDPGIGFGKTKELNAWLRGFSAFIKALDPDVKVMIGYSRKRFLGDNRMDIEPNLAAGRIAIATGADFLRVHDVAAHAALIG